MESTFSPVGEIRYAVEPFTIDEQFVRHNSNRLEAGYHQNPGGMKKKAASSPPRKQPIGDIK